MIVPTVPINQLTLNLRSQYLDFRQKKLSGCRISDLVCVLCKKNKPIFVFPTNKRALPVRMGIINSSHRPSWIVRGYSNCLALSAGKFTQNFLQYLVIGFNQKLTRDTLLVIVWSWVQIPDVYIVLSEQQRADGSRCDQENWLTILSDEDWNDCIYVASRKPDYF